MKLSKNKLNKIKLKRNASRKKHNLRKQKKSVYESSKKRNKRNTHLKRRTLKMYLGGLSDNVTTVNTRTGTNDNADIYGQENNVKKAVDTLSQYVCDPNKLDTIVPDDIDDAVKNIMNLIILSYFVQMIIKSKFWINGLNILKCLRQNLEKTIWVYHHS